MPNRIIVVLLSCGFACTSKAADPPKSFTNKLGMKMVLIPEGTFRMGSDDSDKKADANEKANGGKHSVKVSSHYMQTTEVTVGQFKKFVEATGYRTAAETDGVANYGFNVAKGEFESDPKHTWKSPGFPQTDDHPVVLVSHNDAKAFLSWLSKTEGREYRLPTEAEWERDCRAGTDTVYFNGNDPEKVTEVGNIGDATLKARYPDFVTANVVSNSRDGYVFTAPVGKFPANAFALHDMHGNVWEWCLDGFDAAFYSKSPVVDPRGPDTASERVIRGGGWFIPPTLARSAYRDSYSPGDRSLFLGFRALVPIR